MSENQNPNDSTFYFFAVEPLESTPEAPITIEETTDITIDGNNTADFNNSIFIVEGTMTINTDLSNAILQRGNNIASIIFDENSTKTNVEIK